MTLRVYGRREYAEPLVELGVVDATADAVETYAGEWVELVTFPDTAVHWIIRGGEEVDDG